MKVLFIMNGSFCNHTTSEHLLTGILNALIHEGHKVHVIQMLKKGEGLQLPDSLSGTNITTEAVYVRTMNKRHFIFRYLNANMNYIKCKDALKRNSDSDAVFLQSTNAAGTAVWMTRRYVKKAQITYNVQDVFPYNAMHVGIIKKDSLVFSILAKIQHYGYKHSDHIITISEDMKETLVEDGIPSNKVDVVYNWSYQDDVYEINEDSSVSRMFDKNVFNVVYAGNIGVMQNVEVLIEAAGLLRNEKDIWFSIIGDGLHKERIISETKEQGITNISFWPMQPSELAPAIYCSADVNIVPLAANIYKTALPSKIATCLACKKPIVFAIGENSVFGKRIMNETGCPVIDSNIPGKLSEEIIAIKNKTVKPDTSNFFLRNMSKTENSRQYAMIITTKP